MFIFTPVNCSIQKYYFSNDFLKIKNKPFFRIFIDCQDITVFDGERERTFQPSLEFDFIDIGEIDFNLLNNQQFICLDSDCSTYFVWAHAPIDIEKLSFYNLKSNTISCDIEFNIDFAYQGLEIYSLCENQTINFKNLELEIFPTQTIDLNAS